MTFSPRLSDSTGAPITGIAMLDGDTFLRWLQRGSVKDQLEVRLEGGTARIEGVIAFVETFQWPAGGGSCQRGEVLIL